MVIVPPHSSHTSPCGFSAAAVASVSSHLTAAPVTILDGMLVQFAGNEIDYIFLGAFVMLSVMGLVEEKLLNR